MAASCLSAADWYVRTDGSNANSGSADTSGGAKLTLDAALSIGSLAPGDTIHLGAGTFTGTANTDVDGTAESPITIQGAGVGVTIHEGDINFQDSYYNLRDITVRFYEIDLNDFVTNIVMDGIESLASRRGVYLNPDSRDCQLINSTVHYGGDNGMLNASGYDHLIENNLFAFNNGYDVTRMNNASGITFRGNTYDEIISSPDEPTTSTTSLTFGTGNMTLTVGTGLTNYYTYQAILVWPVAGAGEMRAWVLAYDAGTGELQIRSTWISGGGSGTYSDWNVNLESGENNNHADIWQYFATGEDWFTKDILWEQNLIRNCTAQLSHSVNTGVEANYTNHVFRNNVLISSRLYWVNSAMNFRVMNNTIYDAELTSSGFHNGGPRDETEFEGTMYLHNNLFVRIGGTEGGGVYAGATGADYNFISDLDDTAKTGYSETNGINGGYTPAQIFTDSGNGDVTLLTGSPAIDAGTSLFAYFTNDYLGNTRPAGAAWDIGAYEYGAETARKISRPRHKRIKGILTAP
jgi:hypothetical protein